MSDAGALSAKLAFALDQLTWLATYAIAAFGAGQRLLAPLAMADLDAGLRSSLRLAAGIGVFVVSLFLLAATGLLVSNAILLLVLSGLVAAAAHGLTVVRSSRKIPVSVRPGQVSPREWFWILLILLSVIPLLTRALQIPFQFDELMYHLPTARDWAREGGLTVNESLRYPLSAFNFHLLYAAALVLGNDVFPHLIHAFAGVLVAVGVYSVGRRYFDRRTGFVAALQTIIATLWFYETAYVDLGVGLFLFFGFVALALAYEQQDARWIYLAAFFAGLAVGTKYQGLFYLPVLVLLALAVERRPSVLVRASLVLFFVGGYWYLRNLWISGDPLHPIGGRFFGYWLWNADDLRAQYRDLDGVRGWPEWYLCVAAASVFFLKGSSGIYRGLVAAVLGSALIWILVSGYPRYLVPVYPLLALLSAFVFVRVSDLIGLGRRVGALWARLGKRWRVALPSILLLIIGFSYIDDAKLAWGRIAPTADARDAVLRQRSAAYEILSDVDPDDGLRVFQLGFEGEIYYFPVPVTGDWFGPGRYSEVARRLGKGAELAGYLASMDTNALLINRRHPSFADLALDPDIDRYFTLVRRTDRVELYRLKDRR
ncbi:ArnT family glycosyltransferase [Thiocapsa roseopersicina]|uniref:4-amino-4-deoxy-L-arabinose transferase n=1 Tax=Thiocapsa roseopersicina TaxID=1058 RepID=A0A1H2VA37_THIRO|nr:glycosyltransferase family 39 protein [Thiocapsa roseopersicina]SDW64774.1 4-amino-4-deoxy-L-arabinose transferase [Thiocapsa roseopersicina]